MTTTVRKRCVICGSFLVATGKTGRPPEVCSDQCAKEREKIADDNRGHGETRSDYDLMIYEIAGAKLRQMTRDLVKLAETNPEDPRAIAFIKARDAKRVKLYPKPEPDPPRYCKACEQELPPHFKTGRPPVVHDGDCREMWESWGRRAANITKKNKELRAAGMPLPAPPPGPLRKPYKHIPMDQRPLYWHKILWDKGIDPDTYDPGCTNCCPGGTWTSDAVRPA